MLLNDLQNKMIEAMKARDKDRANALRNLLSELKNARIDNPQMNEQDEVAVVKREAKKRRDAIEALREAQGKLTSSTEGDLKVKLDLEQTELKILQEFLPAEMGDDELASVVHEVVIYLKATSVGDMGRVMGEVMKRAGGRASGDRVAAVVGDKLTNGNS